MGKYWTLERRANRRERSQAMWADPTMRARMLGKRWGQYFPEGVERDLLVTQEKRQARELPRLVDPVEAMLFGQPNA